MFARVFVSISTNVKSASARKYIIIMHYSVSRQSMRRVRMFSGTTGLMSRSLVFASIVGDGDSARTGFYGLIQRSSIFRQAN